MIRTTLVSGILAAGLLAMAMPVAAFPGHARRACADDREAFCPDARGPREVGECLREHEAELSEECRAGYEHMEACRAEVQALCPDLSGRELRACAKERRDEISDDCRPRHRKERCDEVTG